jgi:hypothetical protein
MPVFFRKLRRELSTVSVGGVGVHCPEHLEQGATGCASTSVHCLGVIVFFSGFNFNSISYFILKGGVQRAYLD